ncbi:unnamed protein product [Rhizoctonia solani]|uniref:G-patch domain-containing protein n=1 Tax=Rhizoctonia solani TaxID=456999 RepID=A0A8H2XVJ2_9AGAM|nr:unnamed protein product [Rhizoctonia solani]
MAQRLKRKLDNMGVDPASAKANENFCLIGTPLPSLASTKDANEFVPVWKQEVRDEKGRRRLHGAFTGGFSAGYFNTVGSKEGWTPSTFKSSRNARTTQQVSRPEDFMDEEDLAEMRDSQKLVDTSEPAGSASQFQSSDDSSLTSALQSLTLPSADSPGAMLLRKMGWKPGQGVGPRISYARRRQQDIDAGVVPHGAPEDAEASKHLFAPRDTPVLLFRPKDNTHGLGNTGPVRLGGDVASGNKPSEGPNISAGFGLGALNDADEDDIDVYDGASISRTTRMAYDEIDDNDGDGYSRRRPLTISSQHANRPSQNDMTRGRPVGPVSKFNDGRLVLSGYSLSETPVGQDEWYPLPGVPQGWTADPRRVWTKFSGADGGENKAVGDAGTEAEAVQETRGGWRNAPSAQERGAQLGEPALPQAKKSVFDYLSQKDRDRLLNFRATAGSNTPDGSQPVPPKPTVKPRIAPTTAPTAKAALLGFQPFAADPLRNARYTAYLQYHASAPPVSDPPPASLGLLPDQSAEQFNKEMEDYAKAAAIFKPVTGAMAGRFVGGTSTIIGGAPVVEGGLYQPTYEKKDEESTKVPAPIEEEDPKANAARLGMYGPLTHEVQPWYPHRLLCKRFGVRDPHPDGPPTAPTKTWEEEVGVAPTAPASVDLANVETKPLDAVENSGGEGDAEQDLGPRDLANVGLGDDPHQGVDTLTYVRPAMDVFKAIFASDEEESDEEVDAETPTTKPEAPISALDVALASVRPAPPPASIKADESPEAPVDLATFKPVFNLRTKAKGGDKEKKSKEKKAKKDKGKRATLSFDVDEGADTEDTPSSKGKRRERDGEAARNSKKPRTQDEDEEEWVEKPPPAAVASVGAGDVVHPDSSGVPSTLTEGTGPSRTRKRAIDFM